MNAKIADRLQQLPPYLFADLRRKIGQARDKGVGFLDAPVSGGQAGAENGQLTIMVGGDTDVFERARPVMDCYARAVTLIGPVGAGQLAKMVNQICIAGIVQGLAEGLHFAECAGLDPAACRPPGHRTGQVHRMRGLFRGLYV